MHPLKSLWRSWMHCGISPMFAGVAAVQMTDRHTDSAISFLQEEAMEL